MAILDYLEQVIPDEIKLTSKGDQYHCNCPFCDDTRKRFYVSLETDQVYCHNCGQENKAANGSFISFIMGIEGIEYDAAFKRYKEIKGSMFIPDNVLLELKENIFKPDVSNLVSSRAIPLPDEYTPLELDSPNLVNIRAINYLLRRKISWKQMQFHHMGFCVSGEYQNRVIIPITEGDQLKFWVARAIGDGVKLKEKSPPNAPYQISKSQVIFNIYDASRIYGAAVLAEGVFDALSFGGIGCSLLGKALYDDQLAILLDYYSRGMLPEGVYIALDHDARSQATDLAEALYKYMPVHLVNIPKKYDDPNKFVQKLGKRELIRLVEDAPEYDEAYRFQRKLFG
ncbi:MAG: CHC2 zinc finger domain-containing protein [Lachnospiraceae bacterium]|nr:CHC2 zinc finger domain-containing protein [Lachnospiraceae bacterium]